MRRIFRKIFKLENENKPPGKPEPDAKDKKEFPRAQLTKKGREVMEKLLPQPLEYYYGQEDKKDPKEIVETPDPDCDQKQDPQPNNGDGPGMSIKDFLEKIKNGQKEKKSSLEDSNRVKPKTEEVLKPYLRGKGNNPV